MLWQNDQMNPHYIFLMAILIRLPKLRQFCKISFRLEVRNRLWWNDLICHQMDTNLFFWRYFLIQLIKCRNFYKISFLIGGHDQVVTKWLSLWLNEPFFWWHFLMLLIKCRNFCSRRFLIAGQEQVVTKWLKLWQNENQYYFLMAFNWSNVETFVK